VAPVALPVREAEVLVLGAGLAGLAAALEARRAVRDVLLIALHAPGRSGNSLLAACNFSGVFAPGDSEESFVRDTLRGGADLGEPDLVRAVARGSRELVPFLSGLGVPFQCRGEALAYRANPGHSVPRTIATHRAGIPHTIGGLSITQPLAGAADSEGVRFLRGAAEALRVHGGRVCGARVRGADGLFLVRAGAVVLATGGAGRLYPRSDNAADVTGEGLGLAYGAGAELRDLEFVQFHPTVAAWPVHGVIPTTLFAEGAVLRNRLGECFLDRSGAGGEATVTRDAMSRAILDEVSAGRGEKGGVWLDLAGVPPETLKTYPEVWGAMTRRGLDPTRQPLRVGPAVHYCMGGVTADAVGATTLPGLFAAGEVTGGVHGANRLGGNALTEAVALGRIAGRSAACAAGQAPPGAAQRDEEMAKTPPAHAAREFFRELGAVLWSSGGIRRSREGLEHGLARWAELAKSACPAPAGESWSPILGRLAMGGLILEGALRRTESRGAHFRSDLPAPDPRWRGSLRVTRGAAWDEPVFRFEAAGEPLSQGG